MSESSSPAPVPEAVSLNEIAEDMRNVVMVAGQALVEGPADEAEDVAKLLLGRIEGWANELAVLSRRASGAQETGKLEGIYSDGS
jgi:hypothetical protein